MTKRICRADTNLADLEKRHTESPSAGTKSWLRTAARVLCRERGTAVPEWAVEQRPRRLRPTCGGHMALRDQPAAKRPRATIDLAAGIPPELSAWRAAHVKDGAIVTMRTDAIILATLHERRTFASVAAALAFVQAQHGASVAA